VKGTGAGVGKNMDARGEVGEFIEASRRLCGDDEDSGVSMVRVSGDASRVVPLPGLSGLGGLGDRQPSIFVLWVDFLAFVALSSVEV
jgi:hypothetical protein